MGSSGEQKVEIPEHLESVETLQYIGYTPEKADEIWAAWDAAVASTGPNDSQDSFSYFAIATIGYDSIHPDAYGLEDDWSGIMQRMGIAP